MTDINQAGLEAAQLAIAKCKAVGRTTLEDHAYEAVTTYLDATEGGEDAPQATDDDLVEPSDTERSEWPLATEDYVYGLECIKLSQAARIGYLEDERDGYKAEWQTVQQAADAITAERDRLRAIVAEQRAEKYRVALADIEAKGHTGGYHGRGHSLASVAQAALADTPE